MNTSKEQRVYIMFCLKLGETAFETHGMLGTAFGEDALSKAQMYMYFQDSRMDKLL
jgi:hypothetical protein